MKNVIVLYALFPILLNSCTTRIFKHISREITREQLAGGVSQKNKNHFHDVRMKLVNQIDINEVLKSDTIYFLETFEYETGRIYGKIWSYKGNVDYDFFKNNIRQQSMSFFSSGVINLVQTWNTKNLEEQGEKSPFYPKPFAYASRVIKSNDLNCEVIKFKLF